jgi:TP901 family phage tail tape measure protein
VVTRLVYEADLRTRGFDRGAENIEQRSERMVASANKVQTAFRHFEQGSTASGMTRIGRAAGEVGTRFADMGAAAGAAGRKIVGALEGGLSILRSYIGYGSLVTGILGGVAAKLTILDSAKFESEIGRAAILSQANPEQRAQMMQHARDIGVETPFGPLAVAESMKVEAQRGRSPDQIIALTEATKRFAVIANMDMSHAAEVISQVMFQFGIPMEKATATALKLANAVTATALSGNEMFDALKFAGGAAGVFHVNLTELLAVLGTLRRVADPSLASTSIRNIMLVATALQSKKPKLLREIGLDPEDAAEFSFMEGKVRSLVDVITGLHKVFEKKPELAMKAGFGNRTLIAFEQIAQMAGRSDGFFTTLENRINDTALAERQFNETIELADNLFRRLETTSGAVLVAIGSKIRETFGVDAGVKALDDQIAGVAKTIAAMPKESVHEIVDSLGAGLLQAFSTAITFMAESLMHVATHFGAALIQGAVAALGIAGASGEYKSYLQQYSKMNPAQQGAERTRLAGILGLPSGFNEDDVEGLQNIGNAPFMDDAKVANIRRASALAHLTNPSVAGADEIRAAIANLREAAGNAMSSLATNPTVRAVGNALGAARDGMAFDAMRGAIGAGAKAALGFVNAGVINNYGGSSPAARAHPTRASGSIPQERAQR